MSKILVVDDNKNNRLLLKLLLEDYLDNNEVPSFDIDEAENGKIAAEKAKENSYDIIFMDIMMPELNGIDATKIIHEMNKNVMIIAVSAIDDVESQREILSSGAEDYISKPINADIFNSRIGNYFSLIESRNHQRFNANAVNNYTKEIFNRRMIFMISSEDSLSEFWEYYLLGDGGNSEQLCDVVRAIYALGDLQVKLNISSEVIVEESEKYFYFSLNNLNLLDAKLIKLVMLKNPTISEYQFENSIITFRLSQEDLALEDTAAVLKEPTPIEDKIEIVTTSQENSVYSYIDEDDLAEVELYLGKLSTLLMVIGSSTLEDEEIVEIYTYLERIAKMLNTYSESYTIAKALLELSDAIARDLDVFRDNSESLAPMATAFSNDLSTWNRMVFHVGAPSVDFLDATIIANAQTITSMLSPADDNAVEDLDDIFDF